MSDIGYAQKHPYLVYVVVAALTLFWGIPAALVETIKTGSKAAYAKWRYKWRTEIKEGFRLCNENLAKHKEKNA